MGRLKSTSFASVLMPAVLCAVCFAGCQSTPVNPVRGKAFVWNQDARWEAYEQAFLAARAQGCPKNAAAVEAGFAQISALLLALGDSAAVDDADLDRLERAVFDTAPLVAVCRERLPSFQALQMKLVAATKGWSAGWDLSSPVDRARLYRLVYGSRAALEEAILQGPLDDADVLVHGTAIQHANVPSALVHGVRIESGDILLSRGGAAASALIARGNDFPGYFSHVALVHVDERGVPTVVEAHIEKGVVPTDPEGYLTDKKLRIQVLRHRARGAGDSLLPHRAASHALLDANSRHIPYDFAMDWQRHDRMFCSEVVFAAYESQGIDLWTGM